MDESDSNANKVRDAILRFFETDHTEANKTVKPQDLIAMRPETVGERIPEGL